MNSTEEPAGSVSDAARAVLSPVADALKPDRQPEKSDFDEAIKKRLEGLI